MKRRKERRSYDQHLGLQAEFSLGATVWAPAEDYTTLRLIRCVQEMVLSENTPCTSIRKVCFIFIPFSRKGRFGDVDLPKASQLVKNGAKFIPSA